MSDNPELLDLDALVPARVRSLKYKGENHEFVPISVEDWLANLRDVRELSMFMDRDDVGPDQVAAEQMRVTIASLVRSYPTLTEADFREMGMEKMDAVVKFTRALDGSDKTEAAMRAETGADPLPPAMPEPTTA